VIHCFYSELSGAVMVEDRPIMKGRVTVYSVPGCPHCTQAKATLRTLVCLCVRWI